MLKIYRYACIILTLTSLSHIAYAQSIRKHSTNLNAWFMYFGDHRFSKKWGIHLEAQIRRNEGIARWQQLLLRTALNYHLHPQVFVSAGYAFIQSYPYGAFPINAAYPEHRIWQQLQMKNQTGRFELVSRLRLEQRFSKLPVIMPATMMYEPGDAVYTNRFRFLQRASLPLKGKTIVDHSFYISVYDEIFVNAGNKVGLNIFDQNRAYIALGYKIPQLGRLELGYLEHTVIKGDGIKIENNRTIQVGLTSAFDFIKKKK